MDWKQGANELLAGDGWAGGLVSCSGFEASTSLRIVASQRSTPCVRGESIAVALTTTVYAGVKVPVSAALHLCYRRGPGAPAEWSGDNIYLHDGGR